MDVPGTTRTAFEDAAMSKESTTTTCFLLMNSIVTSTTDVSQGIKF